MEGEVLVSGEEGGAMNDMEARQTISVKVTQGTRTGTQGMGTRPHMRIMDLDRHIDIITLRIGVRLWTLTMSRPRNETAAHILRAIKSVCIS